ncbi:protein-serine O-palmitoleoyltransferase porcupine [Bactrocera oleae]|uniref:protein-serine O-palmitoleoyltransferase porcupine n=1 Tax=Bactrocera oleae TaxID=104688 RepID=UPI00387E4FC8
MYLSYYNYDEPLDYAEEEYDTILEENLSINSWTNLCESCIIPSTMQIIWYMAVLIGFSLLCRMGFVFCYHFPNKKEWLLHLISTSAGCGMLIVAVGTNSFLIIFFAIISYSIFHLVNLFSPFRKNIGVIMVICTILTQLCFEQIWKRQIAWQMIKGSIMVVNMKIISIAFEMEQTVLKSQRGIIVPNVFSFFGYIFTPANLIVGPWVPYSSYLYSIRLNPTQKFRMRRVMWCGFCCLLSLGFINLSNCIVPYLISDPRLIWVRIFRDALAVRCSHYFVSFLSQASISAGGLCLDKDDKPNKWLGYMITQPVYIEFPRSLSSVVRAWNIPMHKFLKEFIFRGIYKRFKSHFVAIFVTYLVSSLLHGQYLKIYLALFSLAIFGFVESQLRKKISNVFNACVTAEPCRKPCRFKYCPSQGWRSDCAILVKLTNLLFSMVTIFHLAYIGAMMESIADEDNDIADNLNVWSTVNFINHWIVLLTYALYLVI